MLNLIISEKGQHFISAMELQKELKSKGEFASWIKRVLKRAFLTQEKDFSLLIKESSGGRRSTDYLLTLDAAKRISIVSFTAKSKEIIDYLIELDKKHETGQAFTSEQIEILIDLSKSMVLVSIQKDCEKKHYNLFNNPYEWYNHRAKILGYSVNDLKDAMKKVNKIHKETRKSLLKLDANELIRTGVIDFFLCLGKSEEYAINVGNLCKKMAEKMDLGTHIWDDTKDNPLKINYREINSCKTIFENTLKSIEKL